MNQQYMQQPHQQPQPPHYGGPPQGAPPYEGSNSNLPPNMMKSPVNSQNFPPQKTMPGPPPPSNIPPPQNAFYNYNAHGDGRQIQSNSPAPQNNQANLTNQMSSMALNNPPTQQNFPPQPTNNMAVPPGNRNGYNGPPHHQLNSGQPDQMLAGPPQARPGMQSSPQGPPPPQVSAQSLPPTQPPLNQFNRFSNEPHQTSNQLQAQRPPGGPNNMNSGPSTTPNMDFSSPSQTRISGQPFMAQNLSGPPQQTLPGPQQQNLSGPPQQNLSGPQQQNLPGPQQQNLSGPPQQKMSGPQQQNLSGPPQQNLSGPPQQNMSGPQQQNMPVPQQKNLSGPPQQNFSSPQQQNLSGPPQQNWSGPPQQKMAGPLQQNFSGPTQQNMSGPPQQNFSGPPQQNFSGPPQQNMTGPQSSPYNAYQQQNIPGTTPGFPQNQNPMMAQRPMMSGPPLSGRQPQPQFPPGAQPGFQNSYPQQPQPYLNMPGAPSPGGFQPGTQPQQAKRLDPESMPSPIQVMQEDQRARGGAFITNQKGLVPPFVTTKFVVQDQGNASPRFIRSTIYTVPTTTDIMKQTGVPFGLILNPMAQVGEDEQEPPIVDMRGVGPVRCIRCKAYMSPFMQFIDAGRRFQCSFCRATTEVPSEYFQHLDHTGQRVDRYERPELMLGTYEFLATEDYCRENTFPKPPAIIFIIDVSYNTVKSGLVHLICAEMKKIIKHLPKDTNQERTNMKVGFITYSNTVHFYNISPNLTQPQMMVVGDTQDVFMPLLDGFLCDAEESEAVIDSLMAQIPAMFAETRETETILAPAIQAGLEALKASNCTGKLMVFHSSLPIAEAPGKLKNRDDRKVLATDKEKTVLAPQNNVYNNLGQSCVGAGCSVDLFIFNNSYVDIATIGQVCRLSGGEVYKYTYFQADIDGDRLVTDVINNISRPIAFDAVMRVRTSTGVRPTDFYGHFFMSNTTDIELASIDCNKAVAVEVKHDDKLSEEEGVYVQVALLYTSCGGVRRLRIINLSLRTSSQMAELYRACDPDAVINFFAKQSVFKLIETSPKVVKDHLISRCATILGAYRKHCASPFSASQLVLPECMKLLPLYVNCLLKSDAISGGADMTIDDRSYVMMAVATMPVHTSVIYFYPRLLPLHDIDPHENELPQQLRCSMDKFMDDGAYLLENGVHMFLWLGLALPTDWIQAVFGTPVVDPERTSLPVLDTPLNKRIREIISRIRAERHHCMRLTIVRQREKLEMVLRHFLVEDRGNDSSPSYIDFLCHMHKEIKTLLSQ